MSNHPKEAVSFRRLRDPSVPIFRGLSFSNNASAYLCHPGQIQRASVIIEYDLEEY
jgi:hypothetical protein